MPFVHEGSLHFVYQFHPFLALRWDPGAGTLTEASTCSTPDWTDSFRGGSQGVPVDGGQLFVVHESELVLGLRVYRHRFVLVDRSLRPVAASPRFSFTPENIEFCAGADVRDGMLVMSFGIEDRSAAVATAPLDAVLGLLEPLAPSRSRA
jgi:hypothetical protein